MTMVTMLTKNNCHFFHYNVHLSLNYCYLPITDVSIEFATSHTRVYIKIAKMYETVYKMMVYP